MMKRQFWLIGIVLLAVLSACRSKSKEGPTDTYSSGVIAIAADESFEPLIQEEIDVFERRYQVAGSVPRYATEGEDIVCAAVTSAVRLVEATVNDVMGLCASVKVNQETAAISLRLPGKMAPTSESSCQYLITGLMVYLSQLHDEYPEHI